MYTHVSKCKNDKIKLKKAPNNPPKSLSIKHELIYMNAYEYIYKHTYIKVHINIYLKLTYLYVCINILSWKVSGYIRLVW
jgi:hypothetical protein